MGIKDLVVSLDPSHEGKQRMRLAIRLARRFKANLVGYYVAPTIGTNVTPAMFGSTTSVDFAAAEGSNVTHAAEAAEAMQQQFEDDLRLCHLAGAWLLSSDPVLGDIVDQIRTADLAIIGLGNPDSSIPDPQGFRPDELILACGCPILGVPIANVPDQIGRNVIVTWDGSRGASRAMNDALPLLRC